MTLQMQLWYPLEVLIQEKQTLINWKYNNSQTLAENDPNSDPGQVHILFSVFIILFGS